MSLKGTMSAGHDGVFQAEYGRSHQESARVKLRRALTLTLMTLLVPGSAQIAAGDRRVGMAALRIWGACLALVFGLVILGLISRTMLFTLVTNGVVLFFVRWGLLILAVGWIYLLFDAWRIGAPLEMNRRHRLVMTGVNAVLAASAAAFALFTSNIVAVQQDFLASVFNASEAAEIEEGRYNILLLGADAGDGRDGMRPDSLSLVSIDEESGETVIIGLPRNLQNVPFPQGSPMAEAFPQGFDCDGCFLNAVNTWANDNAALFVDDEHPGITATMQAVEETTGLDVHYYVLVDMGGFRQLVDAVGGVRIDVKEPVAIGGGSSPITGYIDPGVQVLDGHDALWYARSRAQSDDYARMGRQKCLLGAMADQLSPQTVLTNFSGLAESGKAMVETDIPRSELDTLMDLALKSRQHPVATISLVRPQVDPGSPDFAEIRRMIADVVDAPENAERSAAPAPDPTDASAEDESEEVPEAEAPPEITPSAAEDRQANNTADLADAC